MKEENIMSDNEIILKTKVKESKMIKRSTGTPKQSDEDIRNLNVNNTAVVVITTISTIGLVAGVIYILRPTAGQVFRAIFEHGIFTVRNLTVDAAQQILMGMPPGALVQIGPDTIN
jgi:hypothetical protein